MIKNVKKMTSKFYRIPQRFSLYSICFGESVNTQVMPTANNNNIINNFRDKFKYSASLV